MCSTMLVLLPPVCVGPPVSGLVVYVVRHDPRAGLRPSCRCQTLRGPRRGTLCRCFFFQAEDGIRDGHVTGVQTCALPISGPSSPERDSAGPGGSGDRGGHGRPWLVILVATGIVLAIAVTIARGVYRDRPLEPDAPTPQGSKAVVEVLTDLGTQVRVDRHTEDAAQSLREDRTVLVTAPSSLSAPQLDELAGALGEGEGRGALGAPGSCS